MLISTGSITVNTFLARRAGTQGRCRVALMQYRTLPCLPSNEVTRVLGMEGRGFRDRDTETHRLGIPKDLEGLRDTETLLRVSQGTVLGIRGSQIPSSEAANLKRTPPQSSTPDDSRR